MDKEKKKVKNTVGELNDKKINLVLYPGEGVVVQNNNEDILFKLGSDIREYKFFDYKYYPKTIEEDGICYDGDRYDYIEIPISVWTNYESGDRYIDLINCDKTCIWQGQEIIGMLYEDFIKQFQITPDNIDKEWLRGISTANGRNYDIYTFDSLGISLWVWRKKILEIMISSIDDE